MRVYHLDCCTMCPRGRRAVNGEGSLFGRARLVSHCLLIETDTHGLVLVDTGIGTDDVRDTRRLGPVFGRAMAIDATRTHMPALPQVEALGFRRADVRHIVLTHLDFDHAGGLSDFPDAKVHVHAKERDAALAFRTFNQKQRYRAVQFAHSPAWEIYEALGEPWRGLPSVRQLAGLPPEILALPMPGHTYGHAAIAVDTGRGWLVHAGDAYFHQSVTERGDTSGMPWALRGVERLIAVDYNQVRANHRTLAELAKHPDVTIFSAHDPVEYERLRAESGSFRVPLRACASGTITRTCR
ncbi:MAG: MBL fold metallo-hydrolase [Chloroflexi bacterium]|nr:MBL fold metallo-hydrolase [Chloroflexota bacterium]MBV9895442.1 MBL fold metallo-hydrolase [Chloroflexota bacterium]